jgi:RHS repeat-associated protein
VYTPGVSELRSGTTTYSHSGLKHTAAQSGQSGSVAASRDYDAFGGVATSSGSWQGPFGTAGAFGYQTEALGLHLLGHRYYDASLGRFLTRDPIGDGSNWYVYGGNDPVGFVDPAGLVAVFVDGETDFLAGFADYFTAPPKAPFSFPGCPPFMDPRIDGWTTKKLRRAMDADWTVDEGGEAYNGGHWTGVGYSTLITGVASMDKVASIPIRLIKWPSRPGGFGWNLVIGKPSILRLESHGPWKKGIPKWKWPHVHIGKSKLHLPWEWKP